MSNPAYIVNSRTRVVYPYSADLMALEDPKFIPYEGTELPPIDFKTGVRVVPPNTEEFVNLRHSQSDDDLTEEQRVERIAAVVHLVAPEDMTQSGRPSMLALEKLSKLKDVSRSEVNKALQLRKDLISGKLRKAEEITEERRAEIDIEQANAAIESVLRESRGA